MDPPSDVDGGFFIGRETFKQMPVYGTVVNPATGY
jgi:hypothetical protein